jgi:hypothetical protein
VADQGCGAGTHHSDEAHPLHDVDRLLSRPLPADLGEAQRHAESHRQGEILREQKNHQKKDCRRHVEEQQSSRFEQISHRKLNSRSCAAGEQD